MKKKELNEWVRFLKEDADYDWHYVIRTLRFKLERTGKHILSHNVIENAEKYASEIEEVVNCLKQVENEEPAKELQKKFEKKWGKLIMEYGPTTKDGFRPATIRYSKETPKTKKERIKDTIRLARESNRLRVEALKKAFRLMEKNIWHWWC